MDTKKNDESHNNTQFYFIIIHIYKSIEEEWNWKNRQKLKACKKKVHTLTDQKQQVSITIIKKISSCTAINANKYLWKIEQCAILFNKMCG